MSADLKNLVGLLETVFETEQARLRLCSEELGKAEDSLREVQTARAHRSRALADLPAADVAWAAGHDARWLAWLDRAAAARRGALARAASRHQAQMLATRTAFGRLQALRTTAQLQADEARQKAARRAEDS